MKTFRVISESTWIRRLWLAVVATLAIAKPHCALAWNEVGHETIAWMAYDRLAPETRLKVDKLLLEHPHYHSLLASQPPPNAELARWVFLRASTWADQVRGGYGPAQKSGDITKFSHPTWHYVDVPYVWPRDAAEFSKPIPIKGDLLNEFPHVETTLASKTAPAADRAVALCWILHLVGDLHQPLHTTGMYSHETPDADQGGNGIVVRVGNRVTNLHSLWDGMLGNDSSYAVIGELARRLEGEFFSADFATKLPELKVNTTYEQWVNEGHAAAVENVYLNGKLAFVPANEYYSHHVADAAVPAVNDDYLTHGRAVAEHRAALAAARLADEIQRLLGAP